MLKFIPKFTMRHVIVVLVAALVLVLAANMFVTVPYNHVGILLRAGVVQSETLPEGWRLKIPFVDR